MIKKIKKRLYEILETTTRDDVATQIDDILLAILIFLNILAVILESVGTLSIQYGHLFKTFEVFSIAIFSIEYLMRLWICTLNSNYRHPIIGRIKFILSPLAIIDLAAILPFYFPILLPFDLRFIRILRLLRLLRIIKLGRYSKSLKLVMDVLKEKREEFAVTALILSALLVFSSGLMYVVEHDAQPDKFSSIPATMWWSVATLTTIGYGDLTPITLLGKLMGALIALIGIGIFALPAGIFTSGFIDKIKCKKKVTCPECGKTIEID